MESISAVTSLRGCFELRRLDTAFRDRMYRGTEMTVKRVKSSGKKYDVSTKDLVETYPEDWLRLLGIEAKKVEVIDTELSTVVASADKVLRVTGVSTELVNIEFVSSYKLSAPAQFAEYSVILHHRHGLPVRTIAVLLSRMADGPVMRNEYRIENSFGDWYFRFRFNVIRVWETSIEECLRSGPGTIPLAILTDEAKVDPETAIRRVKNAMREIPESSVKNQLLETYTS